MADERDWKHFAKMAKEKISLLNQLDKLGAL
jgi:hypothetical protein